MIDFLQLVFDKLVSLQELIKMSYTGLFDVEFLIDFLRSVVNITASIV